MPLLYLGFQNLLYRKFVSPGEHDAKAVAFAMGISLSTFYNYIEGVSTTPPDLIPLLYNATKDSEFLSFVTDPTDKRLSDKNPVLNSRSVIDEAFDVTAANGRLVDSVRKALNDARISRAELRTLFNVLGLVRQEVDELEASIKARVG